MELRGKINNVSFNIKGEAILTLDIFNKDTLLNEYESLSKAQLLDIEIKKHREKRSKDANSYAWVLMGKMAHKLKTTKDEIYLVMLERYGVFTHTILKPNAVERFKETYRLVKVLGNVKVNGKEGVQLQCYYGSSTYDTKEMSDFIDGIVRECEELGIETMTPAQLTLLKNEWGK